MCVVVVVACVLLAIQHCGWSRVWTNNIIIIYGIFMSIVFVSFQKTKEKKTLEPVCLYVPPPLLRQLHRIQQKDADTKFKRCTMHFEWPKILFLLHIFIHFISFMLWQCGSTTTTTMTKSQPMVNCTDSK